MSLEMTKNVDTVISYRPVMTSTLTIHFLKKLLNVWHDVCRHVAVRRRTTLTWPVTDPSLHRRTVWA